MANTNVELLKLAYNAEAQWRCVPCNETIDAGELCPRCGEGRKILIPAVQAELLIKYIESLETKVKTNESNLKQYKERTRYLKTCVGLLVYIITYKMITPLQAHKRLLNIF